MEIWKDIEGFEGLYQVSDMGQVRSLPKVVNCGKKGKNEIKGKTLIQTVNPQGYLTVSLYKESRKKIGPIVHRLVAMAFLPNPNNLPQVNHINGNKQDNKANNLEWCTRSQNIKHAFDTGLKVAANGSRNGQSKLTEDQVFYIRSLFNGGASKTELANQFKVSYSCINRVLNKSLWKHI